MAVAQKNYLFDLRKKLSKRNPFVIGGIVLFLLTSVITISTSIPIIKEFIDYKIFYRNTMTKKVEQLKAGIQITAFEDSLGHATFINKYYGKTEQAMKLEPPVNEYVFVNKYFYLDALTDQNGNVVQYSITSKTPDFNPRFYHYYNFDISLGKSAFNELPIGGDIRACVGAHTWYYYEDIKGDNPTEYQSFAFGYNMSGYQHQINSDQGSSALSELSKTNCPGFRNYDESKIDKKSLIIWRSNALINTFLVTAPFYEVYPNNLGIGVDYNKVRTLDYTK